MTRLADAQRALVGLWAFWRADRAQWREPGRLRQWQERRPRRLVQHAYANVPFYRRLYDQAGVNPAAIRSLDDLERLPVITKAQLQGEPPQRGPGDGFRSQIEQELRSVLGPSIGVAFEAVATLEPPPGVKFRLIESWIPRAGGPSSPRPS